MKQTYTIRQLSDRLDLPSSTLRYYEEQGLLPEVDRTEGNQRIYTQEHVDRIGTIQCFKSAGMSIARLRSFFEYEKDERAHMGDIIGLLQQQQEEVRQQLEKLERDSRQIQLKLGYYQAIKEAYDKGQEAPDWCEFVAAYKFRKS